MKNLNLIFIILVIIVLSDCKKEPKTIQINDQSGLDKVVNSEVEAIDKLPFDTVTKFEDMYFNDGTNVKAFLEQTDPDFLNKMGFHKTHQELSGLSGDQQKKLLIGEMETVAYQMTDRSNHQYMNEGANKPAQNGLAYVYGSKQYAYRETAVENCKTDQRYGVDCSGMIYQLALQAKLDLTDKPADVCSVNFLSSVKNWNNALAISTGFSNLIATIIEPTPLASQIQYGDIVIWPDHIGMVFNQQTLSIFLANGFNDASKCALNNDVNHGPVRHILTANYLADFPGAYKIIRFEPVNSASNTLSASFDVNGASTTLNIWQGSNGVIKFYDKSIGNPTTWLWSFPGGSPSVSSEQNPTVTYNNGSGMFNVCLIAGNSNVTDTISKNSYINVIGASGGPGIAHFTDIRDGKNYNSISYGNGLKLVVNVLDFASGNSILINGIRYYTYQDALNSIPAGCHIPTDIEWQQIETRFGMCSCISAKEGIRDAGTDTALAYLKRYLGYVKIIGGTPQLINNGQVGAFWSSTNHPASTAWAWARKISKSTPRIIYRFGYDKSEYYPIAFIQD